MKTYERRQRLPHGSCVDGEGAARPGIRIRLAIVVCGLVAGSSAMAQSRGELLYTTHCISCHTTQMHWRDKRAVRDWTSLRFQVRRWQDAASLSWSDGDIQEVARYLNDTIYHFKQTDRPVSSWLGSDAGTRTSSGPAASAIERL